MNNIRYLPRSHAGAIFNEINSNTVISTPDTLITKGSNGSSRTNINSKQSSNYQVKTMYAFGDGTSFIFNDATAKASRKIILDNFNNWHDTETADTDNVPVHIDADNNLAFADGRYRVNYCMRYRFNDATFNKTPHQTLVSTVPQFASGSTVTPATECYNGTGYVQLHTRLNLTGVAKPLTPEDFDDWTIDANEPRDAPFVVQRKFGIYQKCAEYAQEETTPDIPPEDTGSEAPVKPFNEDPSWTYADTGSFPPTDAGCGYVLEDFNIQPIVPDVFYKPTINTGSMGTGSVYSDAQTNIGRYETRGTICFEIVTSGSIRYTYLLSEANGYNSPISGKPCLQFIANVEYNLSDPYNNGMPSPPDIIFDNAFVEIEAMPATLQ